MIIYLDVLVAINFCITYFSLRCTARLLHTDCRTWRLITASALGGISSLSAAVPLGFISSLLLKTSVTALIVFASFGFGGISAFVMRTLITAVAGTLVCGITIMLRELTGSSFFAAAGGYPYLDISILHLIISTVAVYVIICLYRRVSDKPQSSEMIKLIIKKDGVTAEVKAFPDSGNNLRDFYTGLPVIVCRKKNIISLLPDFSNDPKGVRIIPFSSVGGSGIIYAFHADSITAYLENGRITQIEALIGTNEDALENENFDAVINPKIII